MIFKLKTWKIIAYHFYKTFKLNQINEISTIIFSHQANLNSPSKGYQVINKEWYFSSNCNNLSQVSRSHSSNQFKKGLRERIMLVKKWCWAESTFSGFVLWPYIYLQHRIFHFIPSSLSRPPVIGSCKIRIRAYGK